MFDFSTRISGEPVRVIVPEVPARADARTIGRRLWRGAGFIVLGGILMVAAAIAILGLIPPIYTSTVQLLVDPSDPHGAETDAQTRASLMDRGVAMTESQVRVLRSDTVLRRVIETLHLDQDEDFIRPEARNPVFYWFKGVMDGAPPATSRDPMNVALDMLRRNTSVRRPEQTFVIDVTEQSRDPVQAATIANAIADAFFAEEAAARLDAAKRASDALTGRLASLKGDVEETERQIGQYREEHRLVAPGGRPLTDQQLGDLNQQLFTASIKTAEVKARLEQARKMRTTDPSTALPEMLQSPEMQALRQQYATLSRSTAELATRLGERHPAMAEQYAQQRDLQRLIQREKERIIDTLQKDYDRAAANESTLRSNLDKVKAETSTSDRASAGLRELERTLEARKGVYEAYLRRIREANELERPSPSNVRIISAATPAVHRTFPPSPKVVLPIALLIGLALGAGVALLLGADAERRRSLRDAARATRSLRAADA